MFIMLYTLKAYLGIYNRLKQFIYTRCLARVTGSIIFHYNIIYANTVYMYAFY